MYFRELNHENIVKFYGLYKNPTGQIIVVMEVLPITLEDCIAKKTVHYAAVYLQWVMQIAAALDYLASQKIVHRDVKLNNIMVCANSIIDM